MNRRQRKKAQKRAQKEAMRKKVDKAVDAMDLSPAQQQTIERTIDQAEAEGAQREAEAEKLMAQQADALAKTATAALEAEMARMAADVKTAPSPQAAVEQPVAPAPTPKVEAPKSRSILQRAREAPSALGSMIASSLGNLRFNAPTEDQKKTRAEIVKINNQLIMTTKIIDANKDELEKLAKTDSNVAKILETTSSAQLKSIKDVQARILAGQEISADQSKELIASLEQVTGIISSSQVSLTAKFSDISDNFSSMILDERLDREDRRAMIEELVKISKSSELQKQFTESQQASLKELEAMSKSGLNFDSDQNANLVRIFTQLKSEGLDNVKLRGTLNDLNESMESAVLTQEDLAKRLEEKDDKGNTLREKAGEGIKSLGKTLKAGAIDYMLSQVGLGGLGLGDMFSEVGLGSIGAGLGKAGGLLNKIPGVGKLGGLGSKVGGKLLGSVGSKIGGVLGKAALPLALLKGGYDAYQGFTNADEIAGVEPGKASLGQKFGAAGASVISGLAFGMVDPKTVYDNIGKGMDFLFDRNDGVLSKTASFLKKAFELTPIGFVLAHFDTIKKGFGMLFGADGILSKMGKFLIDLPGMLFETVKEIFESPESLITKVQESFATIFDFLFGEEGIFSLNTAKKAIASAGDAVLPDFIKKRISASSAPGKSASPVAVEPQKANVNSQAANLAVDDEQRQRQIREQQLAASSKPQTVVVSAPATPAPTSTSRSAKVDDVQLAVMNAGMAGI